MNRIVKSIAVGLLCLMSSYVSGQVGTWPVNSNYLYFGANELNQSILGNYSLLQEKIVGTTYLNSPLDIYFRIGNSTKMYLTNGGNIGIGTTAPVGLLEVKGAYTGNSQLTINATGTSGELRFSEDGVPKGFVWYGKSGNYMAFGRGSTNNSLFVDAAGNFGLGTQTPTQKLTVNGTIYGKEVKVDLSVPGPDYVFDDDYKLTPLEDIKAYIDQHKHLPEVPSAKEMEKEGILLGEMNMLLLKKMEEMTLYMIELKKENDLLKTRIKKIETGK